MVKKDGSRVVFADDVAADGHGEPQGGAADEPAGDDAAEAAPAEMRRIAAAMCRQLRAILAMPRTLPHAAPACII